MWMVDDLFFVQVAWKNVWSQALIRLPMGNNMCSVIALVIAKLAVRQHCTAIQRNAVGRLKRAKLEALSNPYVLQSGWFLIQ